VDSEITPNNQNTAPKTGFEKIVDFINNLELNHPVAIAEIVDKTGLSWTYVKRILSEQLKDKYDGFNLEKSGNTWIMWKDRDKIIKKLDDTCGDLLK
jgi:AraC-like DNA-binding protein